MEMDDGISFPENLCRLNNSRKVNKDQAFLLYQQQKQNCHQEKQ